MPKGKPRKKNNKTPGTTRNSAKRKRATDDEVFDDLVVNAEGSPGALSVNSDRISQMEDLSDQEDGASMISNQ